MYQTLDGKLKAIKGKYKELTDNQLKTPGFAAATSRMGRGTMGQQYLRTMKTNIWTSQQKKVTLRQNKKKQQAVPKKQCRKHL